MGREKGEIMIIGLNSYAAHYAAISSEYEEEANKYKKINNKEKEEFYRKEAKKYKEMAENETF